MTTTTSKLFTLQQYLAYDDGTDKRYELADGELLEMPPESDLNNLIAIYLIGVLSQAVPIRLLRRGTEIVVSGSRTTARIPDLIVLTEDLATALVGASRSTILPDMPPPVLVVEIASPGKENQDRDYRYKRSEYAARGIAEYWIVDPDRAQVTLFTLVDGLYEEAVYRGSDRLLSSQFPNLTLTIEQILKAE